NLSTKGYLDLLAEHPSGVYFGWAGLSSRDVFKMVMSIGWNPYFDNKEKTIGPWILHKFDEDFYGKELRLIIVGYIRPEVINIFIYLVEIHEINYILDTYVSLGRSDALNGKVTIASFGRPAAIAKARPVLS
ncbi:bifunctional riboflavin kinase/FMN phosphatase-like, partial [Arachis ipaensis]|uniref:bifunctional riboflavin kinase/FMN phosphatase-like n=1 Tax=Arachis ipaensis TaxID=130454 RepID=UPI000A2B4748